MRKAIEKLEHIPPTDVERYRRGQFTHEITPPPPIGLPGLRPSAPAAPPSKAQPPASSAVPDRTATLRPSDGSTSAGAIPKDDNAPKGWLRAHEDAGGGHLIQKHVEKTDAELFERFKEESHIPGSSTFESIEAAEHAVRRTIESNAKEIEAFLKDPSQSQKIITFDVGEPVGRVIPNGSTASQPSSKVKLLLDKRPGMSDGYRIRTGYLEH